MRRVLWRHLDQHSPDQLHPFVVEQTELDHLVVLRSLQRPHPVRFDRPRYGSRHTPDLPRACGVVISDFRRASAALTTQGFSAAMPGSSRPCTNSSEAPPPVETCETLSARPALAIAAAESPPPTTVSGSLLS